MCIHPFPVRCSVWLVPKQAYSHSIIVNPHLKLIFATLVCPVEHWTTQWGSQAQCSSDVRADAPWNVRLAPKKDSRLTWICNTLTRVGHDWATKPPLYPSSMPTLMRRTWLRSGVSPFSTALQGGDLGKNAVENSAHVWSWVHAEEVCHTLLSLALQVLP